RLKELWRGRLCQMLAGISHDTYDLEGSFFFQGWFQDDSLAECIFIGPISPRHGLVDNNYWRSLKRVAFSQQSPFQQSQIKQTKVIGADQVIISTQWFVWSGGSAAFDSERLICL